MNIRYLRTIEKYIALGLMVLVVFPPSVSAEEIKPAKWVGVDLTGEKCAGTVKGYGPYDYHDASHFEQRKLVEQFHFTNKVERLQDDDNLKSGSVVQNLDYIIMAFPNHQRALNSMINYAISGMEQTERLKSRPECYLQRAIEYTKQDWTVYLLYGTYLHKKKQYDKAEEMYQKVIENSPYPTEAHYNLALLYVQTNRIEMATKHAKLAYAKGYPLPGLRMMLKKKGVDF